jgi:hypothetical protein
MRRNMGPAAGLVFAALIVVRYAVLRGNAGGLSHGSARSLLGILVIVALISVRIWARRR